MKHALLVLGFRHAPSLGAALPIYAEAELDVFLHLDEKAPADGYIAALGPAAAWVTLIPERHRIFWAGFAMVEAEMSLLRAAIAAGPYDSYTLLSDDSFPLLGQDYLRALLSRPRDKIAIRRLTDDDAFMARYRDFYFFDHAATSLLGRPVETAKVDEELFFHLRVIQRLREQGKKRLDIHYGSQWWSLQSRTAEAILALAEQDHHLVDSFRYSAVPDELFFQTIYASQASTHPEPSPMLVDWKRDPKPYIFRALDDIRPLIRPHHGFVRKVSDQEGLLLRMRQNITATGQAMGSDG